jgi:hypothetical protein
MATLTAPAQINWRLAKRYIRQYDSFVQWESCEPTTVCLYEVRSKFGGPEEGGWYYECGYHLGTTCVFSRKQAIREAVYLHLQAIEDYEEEYDYLGWRNFSIDFDTKYGKDYPTERPYYC